MDNPDDNPPIDYNKVAALRPDAAPAQKTPSLLGYGTYYAASPLADPSYFEAPPERPAGVTILAVLNFIAAGLYIIGLLIIMGASDDDPGAAAVVIAVQAIAALFIAVGLLRLQRWAYYLALVGYGLTLVSTLLGSFSSPITGGTLISLIIAAAVLYYLAQSRVREAFAL